MRPRFIVLLFGLCLLLLLVPVAWISYTALRLERAELEARAQAALQENIRLALWRMDSALVPLIAQERARPYFVYTSFYRAESAYPHMFNNAQAGDELVPSPLLALDGNPFVLLHFQFDPQGELTSPQVPAPALRPLAALAGGTAEQIDAAAARLAALRARLRPDTLTAQVPALDGASSPPIVRLPPQVQQQRSAQFPEQSQEQRNINEFAARSRTYETQYAQKLASPAAGGGGGLEGQVNGVREGMFVPLWAGEDLVLARRVVVGADEYIQGCWLNWEALRPFLLENVADLVQDGQLQPEGDAADGRAHRLAGLPVHLTAASVPPDAASLPPQVRLPLAVAWVCVLLAAAAVGALLVGTVMLSERRASFVSAVTHELRTPLTTFRLYTDMLASDRLRDEEKRATYVETLRREALRLAHLVENVLAYARLERRRPARAERVRVGDLLERVEPRLRERAAQSAVELRVSADAAADSVMLADGSAVEQVLFNLVDNACKYGAAPQRRVELSVVEGAKRVEWRVRDFGPGLQPARRLFQPFHKSAAEAAGGPAGVGLGLALSRRLARAMGGDLRPEKCAQGACFLLSLPRAANGG